MSLNSSLISFWSNVNREAISLKAKSLFNYAAIGKHYADVYEEVLNSNKKTIDQPKLINPKPLVISWIEFNIGIKTEYVILDMSIFDFIL